MCCNEHYSTESTVFCPRKQYSYCIIFLFFWYKSNYPVLKHAHDCYHMMVLYCAFLPRNSKTRGINSKLVRIPDSHISSLRWYCSNDVLVYFELFLSSSSSWCAGKPNTRVLQRWSSLGDWSWYFWSSSRSLIARSRLPCEGMCFATMHLQDLNMSRNNRIFFCHTEGIWSTGSVRWAVIFYFWHFWTIWLWARFRRNISAWFEQSQFNLLVSW